VFSIVQCVTGPVKIIPVVVAAAAGEADNTVVLAVVHNAVRRHREVGKAAVMADTDGLREEVQMFDCCGGCPP
jgi:hypothetical protein